ncbi:MAG: hypothetical protein M0002_11940 [Rhodospirillales bacterium]|nr:hypothetical protein [Rhodospirillales bacterium]
MHGHSGVRRRALAALAVTAMLAGCQLPDQRTFGAAPDLPPAPPRPAAAKSPPAWPGPPPLATIQFANRSADYVGPLGAAVQAAEARKPDVVFMIVGVAPAGGSPAAQQAAAAGAAKAARAVMQAIERMGVPATRLLLAARTDPTVKAQQVEVYVR